MSVSYSTDPSSAIKNATILIVEDCSLFHVKSPIKSGILVVQLRVGANISGNSWTIVLALGSVRQILE